MRIIVLILLIANTSFGSDLDLAISKTACQMEKMECDLALKQIQDKGELRKAYNPWITLAAMTIFAGAGYVIDSDNRWQGAFVGTLGAWGGAKMLKYEF